MHHHALCFTVKHILHCHALFQCQTYTTTHCFIVKHTLHHHALFFYCQTYTASSCTVLLSNIHHDAPFYCQTNIHHDAPFYCQKHYIIMHRFTVKQTLHHHALFYCQTNITSSCSFSTEHTQAHPTQHTPTITVRNIHFHTNAALNCTIIITDYLRHPISQEPGAFPTAFRSTLSSHSYTNACMHTPRHHTTNACTTTDSLMVKRNDKSV